MGEIERSCSKRTLSAVMVIIKGRSCCIGGLHVLGVFADSEAAIGLPWESSKANLEYIELGN